jgi:uncharacterized protein (DUF427 family)
MRDIPASRRAPLPPSTATVATVAGYPSPLVPPGRVAPVPRRVRAVRAGDVVVDTTAALYVWEWDHYPLYYVPLSDVRTGLLAGDGVVEGGPFGLFERHSVAGQRGAASVMGAAVGPPLGGTVHIRWDALDAWFEEDEQVFVHPRNPYSRVDAVRSTRQVRVERDGILLAESDSPIMVFETGLPTRYYINRMEVDFRYLVPSDTVTSCPYKGTTSGYWSVEANGSRYPDLAWTYVFPTASLSPIAGLIAFYNEKVDIWLDGIPQERPRTHFS